MMHSDQGDGDAGGAGRAHAAGNPGAGGSAGAPAAGDLAAGAPAAPEIMQFPMAFPIKVMGKRVDGFADTITDIIRAHAPDFDPATLEVRLSKGGNYLSLTATIEARSRDQLDALYRALSGHPLVSIVL